MKPDKILLSFSTSKNDITRTYKTQENQITITKVMM